MRTFKVLVLTDHSGHSKSNSFYGVVNALRVHKNIEKIDVASKGIDLNASFFSGTDLSKVFVNHLEKGIRYSKGGNFFQGEKKWISPAHYDVIVLRLPPPIEEPFFLKLKKYFPQILFINDPEGIIHTYSKSFLLNFRSICPPLELVSSKKEILKVLEKYPIVLKPLKSYGGKGIVRIKDNSVEIGQEKLSLEDFWDSYQNETYLAVKFLENVRLGDKRIVVVNGHVIGASLRTPPADSWICNAAMGGSAHPAFLEQEELEIIEQINPLLEKHGIVMYGVDTLVGDSGKRVLSEINTASIGGIVQMAKMYGKSTMLKTINNLVEYVLNKKYGISKV